jgi:hypothetical protein
MMTRLRPKPIPTPIGPVKLADLPPTGPVAPPDIFAQQRARELWALRLRGQVLDQLLDGAVAVREADRVLAAVDRVLASRRRGRRGTDTGDRCRPESSGPARVYRVRWPPL